MSGFSSEVDGNSGFRSLARFPNYSSPRTLEVIDAHTITRKEFDARYVERNVPCLVKNAVLHWPAYERWSDLAYLRSRSTNTPVTFCTRIVPETSGWADPKIRTNLRTELMTRMQKLPFHEFLARVVPDNTQMLVAGCPLLPGSALEQMSGDVAGMPFMPVIRKPRFYAPYRTFLYRNSYTDWHFHPTDETFMTQIVGAKEVLLLPPDEETWDQIYPIIQKRGYLYDIDTSEFPGVRRLRAYRVTVEPGDALYIPVFWWHAVESVPNDFGATIAATFPTPLHINGDTRFPVARKLARTWLKTRHAPMVVAALACAAAYKLTRRPGGL